VEQDKPLTAGQLPESDLEVRRLLEAGRLAEANVLFDKVVAHQPPVDDQTVRAALQVYRAVSAWQLGRIPLALELAADGWTQLGSPNAEGPAAAHTWGLLGYLLEGMGNRRAALETLRTSVRLARDAGNQLILAGNLQRLGGTLNFRAAELPAEQALPVFEEARMVLADGLQLNSNARLHRALLGAYGRSLAGLGELAAAAEAGRQVLRLGTEAEDRWATAVGEWVLAVVSRAHGELADARTQAARAVASAEQINDTHLILRFSLDLADICALLDDAVGEAAALRRSVAASRKAADALREGLG
jgi:two-component system, cell cycle response regulator